MSPAHLSSLKWSSRKRITAQKHQCKSGVGFRTGSPNDATKGLDHALGEPSLRVPRSLSVSCMHHRVRTFHPRSGSCLPWQRF